MTEEKEPEWAPYVQSFTVARQAAVNVDVGDVVRFSDKGKPYLVTGIRLGIDETTYEVRRAA